MLQVYRTDGKGHVTGLRDRREGSCYRFTGQTGRVMLQVYGTDGCGHVTGLRDRREGSRPESELNLQDTVGGLLDSWLLNVPATC